MIIFKKEACVRPVHLISDNSMWKGSIIMNNDIFFYSSLDRPTTANRSYLCLYVFTKLSFTVAPLCKQIKDQSSLKTKIKISETIE